MNTGDGQLTAIHTLNVVVEEGKALSELTKDFVIYPQLLKNVGVSNKDAIMCHEGLLAKIKELETSLNGNGRILVRASGTEQLVRVMVEATTLDICEKIASTLVDYINYISY